MAGLMPESLELLLTTGKYSDFTFTCKGKEFPVHKAVVCAESEFFRAVCESAFKESREARLDLPDDDPAIVERVLRYLYLGEYEPKQLPRDVTAEVTDPSSSRCKHLLDHVLLYQFADKAGITSLKDLAFKNLTGDISTYASSWGLPQNFPAVAQAVFDATMVNDLTLRLAFIQACVGLYDCIENDKETLKVLEEHEPIAWALGVASEKAKEGESDLQNARFQLIKDSRDKLMEEMTKLAKNMSTLEAASSEAVTEFSTYKDKVTKLLSALKKGRHCLHCGKMVQGTGFSVQGHIFTIKCQNCWQSEIIE